MRRIIERVKPYARAVRFSRLYRGALREANRAESSPPTQSHALSFIIGCGRSGTTILGKVFATHPDVAYLFEPYHAWAAIDPRTDMLNLYVDCAQARCVLDAEDVNNDVRRRFRALIASAAKKQGRRHTMEKTPINAMRIGYLNALAPASKFVHIVRDGVDVARSIHRLASTNTYRIAGKPELNQWWGVSDRKWMCLTDDGRTRDLLPEEIDHCLTHEQRGAYEWLLTLTEVDRHRDLLGDRLFEFTYDQLTSDAAGVLEAICEHCGVAADEQWLAASSKAIDDARRNPGSALQLPPRAAALFNRFQQRYGFAGRAESSARDTARAAMS